MSDKSPAVVPENEGRVLHAFGEEVTILLDCERTAGKLTMWTEITPPGGGPPPHYHLNEDEIFHVVEGRVAFLMNGEWHEVGPGGAAFMPRGVLHTFKNVGHQPLECYSPLSPADPTCRGSCKSVSSTEFIFCRTKHRQRCHGRLGLQQLCVEVDLRHEFHELARRKSPTRFLANRHREISENSCN